MMRIFQGVDIVEIPKLKRILLNNANFISDIFTEKEKEYCLSRKDPHIHFAGRFAAKEASLKALGMGMSGIGIDHSFQEIEVIPKASGKPMLSFSGWVEKISQKKRINQFTVSISHSDNYAVATVILTGQDNV
jgi:holo-[acyl-carrier protein] synthase